MYAIRSYYAMLPCNVIIQEKEEGKIEVAAIDPIASMQAVANENLGEIAKTVQLKLKNVIDNIFSLVYVFVPIFWILSFKRNNFV